jgi:hypothetical protein
VSSQDGPNRSQRTRRTSGQQRPGDTSRRPNQSWDIDPAEIDRYLSGRPSRAEDATRRPGRGDASGDTAEQLSRLQNAVGRQPRQREQEPTATYRTRQTRQEPQPVEHYDDEGYVDDAAYDVSYTDDVQSYGYEDEPWIDEAPASPPRRSPSPRQPSQPPRTSRRYEPEPSSYLPDDEYDDELYNDDPYLGYEDDDIDVRPARPARQRQRSGGSRPAMPKITIPSSISDSPMLADRMALIMIGVSLLSLALMAFIVSDRINLLGSTIPTHVSASGDPEQLQTPDAVWNIPLLAGMVMLMNFAASWFISRIDGFATRFLLASGLLVHFIAWVALIKYLWE